MEQRDVPILQGAIWCGAVCLMAFATAGTIREQPEKGDFQYVVPELVGTLQPSGMYRLTAEQYRNSIRDIFGPDFEAGGRFEPLSRRAHGLLAAGSYQIAVSPAGMEQYALMATSIATKVVDENHRAALVHCEPVAPNIPDDRCATQFFSHIGPLVFRRPLTKAELNRYVVRADKAALTEHDFYRGLGDSLESMLASLPFLLQMDMAEPDPHHPGELRLDGYSMAARLSFFLWDTTPDLELLSAAARGDLHNPAGLSRQVDRLLASPRLKDGVRAFFSDMLRFEQLDELAKDTIIYPRFVLDVKKDMPEQTLRTITYLLLDENRDYRELFTSRQTFLTRTLGALYGVKVSKAQGWMAFEFPEDSPRAGILTQMNFLAMFAHNGRSSPTLRGRGLRELLLCQAIPDPPANVDFTSFQKSEGVLSTVRERLAAHATNPVCAGCHKLTDPIGLALENFDGIGVYRARENGAEIDANVSFAGAAVKDPVEFGKAIANAPAATSCVVNRLVEYGTHRPPAGEWVGNLEKRFTSSGYRFRDLLRDIATTDDLYNPKADDTKVTGSKVTASNP
jgi:hypothetical protein